MFQHFSSNLHVYNIKTDLIIAKIILLARTFIYLGFSYCSEDNDLYGFSKINTTNKVKYATEGELQHIVYIEIEKLAVCSGAIINESWILTAAHCFINEEYTVENPKTVQITAGIVDYMLTIVNSKQDSIASKIIVHPSYKVNRLSYYDIALVKLETPFEFDLSVFYIELDGDMWPNKDGTIPRICTASGFGLIKPDGKKNTRLKLFEVNALHGDWSCPCTKRYQSKRLVCLPPSSKPILCAGDSGSVLVCNNKAVAVAHMPVDKRSCVVNRLQTEFVKCGKNDIIPMYMFLCPMNDWIHSYVSNVPKTPPSCKALKHEFSVLGLSFCVIISITIK